MKYMNVNDLGRAPYQRRWTRQAAECYYLGCVCEKCSIPEDFKEKCHMKASVLELVRLEKEMPEDFKRERNDIINEDEENGCKKVS